MTWKQHVLRAIGPKATDALRSFRRRHPPRRVRGSLAALATYFGSDKWGSHWYASHYEWHLARFRNRRLTLLEIGIGGYDDPEDGGGSLRAWKWFFPRGQIVGIDIHDKRSHEESRIRTFQGSQDDPEFLADVVREVGRPEIIVDDGSHFSHHVIKTFETLFPLLADDGVYAIEDTQTSYWPTWHGEIGPDVSASTTAGYFARLTHALNHREFLIPGYLPSTFDQSIVAIHFYHNLILIQKGTNDEESNMVVNGVLRR